MTRERKMFRLANCTRQNSVCCTHAADRITMKQSRRFALLDSSVKVPTKRIRRHFHPRNNQNKGTNNLQSSFQCLYISPSIVACFVSTLVGLLCESRGPSVTFTERKNCLLEKHGSAKKIFLVFHSQPRANRTQPQKEHRTQILVFLSHCFCSLVDRSLVKLSACFWFFVLCECR